MYCCLAGRHQHVCRALKSKIVSSQSLSLVYIYSSAISWSRYVQNLQIALRVQGQSRIVASIYFESSTRIVEKILKTSCISLVEHCLSGPHHRRHEEHQERSDSYPPGRARTAHCGLPRLREPVKFPLDMQSTASLVQKAIQSTLPPSSLHLLPV